MATFIERMRTLANDEESVERTFAEEYKKKKERGKEDDFSREP